MIMMCDLSEGYKSQMVKWNFFFFFNTLVTHGLEPMT
jgi:hypothetical protein